MNVTDRAVVQRMVVPAGWVLAGALLLGAGGVRWISTGPGSQFGGLELADSLRTGVFSPDWGVWVAVSVYSIVGVGGGLIATAMLTNPIVLWARAVVCVLGLVAFVLLGWGVLPIDNWAAGPTMATIAFAISTVLSAFQLITTSRG